MKTVVKSVKALMTVALAMLAAPMGGLLGGCDGAGQGAVEPASIPERSAARGLIRQIAAIAEQPDAPQRLLDATDATALVALVTPPGTPVAGLTPDPHSTAGAVPASPQTDALADALAGCVLATGTAATLTECELGDHVVDGTWSIQHQRLHAELVDVFVVGASGHRGSLWLDANLSSAGSPAGDHATPDATPDATIDGSLEASLMWSINGLDHALDASIHIEGLTLEGQDDSACATAGTVTISGRLASAARTTTTLWFGPTCRDIHISRQTSR